MEQGATDSTSTSLIRGLKADDTIAWNRLVKTYGPLVYAWCRKAGLANADVADVAQEVFLSVHRSIGRFRRERPGGSFHGWLWQITRNAVLAHLRRHRHQPHAAGGTHVQQAFAQTPDMLGSDDPPSDVGTQVLVVRQALGELRSQFQENSWKAFWRTTVDEQPATEVAKELGMSPDAVRQAKRRVLVKLREFLAED